MVVPVVLRCRFNPLLRLFSGSGKICSAIHKARTRTAGHAVPLWRGQNHNAAFGSIRKTKPTSHLCDHGCSGENCRSTRNIIATSFPGLRFREAPAQRRVEPRPDGSVAEEK